MSLFTILSGMAFAGAVFVVWSWWRVAPSGPPRTFDDALAELGTGGEAVRSIDRDIHTASWGAKLLVFFVLGFTTLITVQHYQDGLLFGDSAGAFLNLGLIALGLWLSAWTLTFRIEIDRDTLTLRGMDLRMHEYRLRDLLALKENDNKTWSLFLADGRKVRVMRMVVGAGVLRQRLEDAINANLRS